MKRPAAAVIEEAVERARDSKVQKTAIEVATESAKALPVPDRSDRNFVWNNEDKDEPHVLRRAEILKKYPEIKELFGYEWKTKYIAGGTVALQIFCAWVTQEWRWPAYLAVVYIIGATANHSLFLAVHELSHNSGASRPEYNKAIGLMANLGIGIPYSVTFKPYHMEHHRFQGQDGEDSDLPTWLEGWAVTATACCYLDHVIRKAIFMFIQIFFYALRPMFIKPGVVPVDRWLAANWVCTFGFDALLLVYVGPNALMYLILSSFFAGSIHPTAGHFLAEHYVTVGRVETYSYYGPLNYLAYNVGYHNEHHDFPSIPWSRLPKVREIAPEYYNDLPQCKSWPGMLFNYIFDDSMGPFARVKRPSMRAKRA